MSNWRMKRGFSLVEVIVVMGIMAIAVGVLLPAVHRARSRSQEVFCQANLRTLSAGLLQYQMEYNDRFPFGYVWNRTHPATGRTSDNANSGVIAWYSAIDKYLTGGVSEIYLLDANSGIIDGSTNRNFHSAFKCPSVSSTFQQRVHYFQHSVVMPHTTLEYPQQLRASGMPIVQPAKVNQVYPDTALIWDTPLWSNAAPVTPLMFWTTSDAVGGVAPIVSKIDHGLLAKPANTELRFRGAGLDRFMNSTNPLRHPHGPIYWPSDAVVQASGLFTSYNADSTGGSMIPFTMGSARFRHTGLGCNVLFADGSVRTLYLRPSRKVADGPVGTGSADYIDSDFRRHMLMIKWPPGFTDTNTVPTN